MSHAIVAGLDGSAESLAAADWAAQEARRRGTTLRLVHAWEPGPYSYLPLGGPEPQPEWADRVPREAAATLLNRYPELSIETEETADHPVTVLTDAATHAELLALGSRGLSGFTGFLVGSVSLAVVARVERPVALIRAERDHRQATRGQDTATALPEVVLGLKLGADDDAPIRFAFDAAARRQLPLRVLHTWNFPPSYGYAAGTVDPSLLTELATQEEQAVAEALASWRDSYPDVVVTTSIRSGRAGHLLVEAAADAALVVVGRHIRHSVLGSHIGPVVHAVMHHCEAPIAVVPHH